MNGRKAAREAAKIIENLENHCRRSALDIRAYNQVILDMIDGKSPCEWCEDRDECENENLNGNGCKDWMLTFAVQQKGEENESETDKSERLSETSSLCGT